MQTGLDPLLVSLQDSLRTAFNFRRRLDTPDQLGLGIVADILARVILGRLLFQKTQILLARQLQRGVGNISTLPRSSWSVSSKGASELNLSGVIFTASGALTVIIF